MTHLWVRAESRANETRVAITPDGARSLRAAGFRITVEDSATRCISDEAYRGAGADMAETGSWPKAPEDAIIIGLKELPKSDHPLSHRHVMFGHAYKGQLAGQELLRRLRAGGGTLLDLEYLTDATGRRLAAFGYWAGYAGAAVSLRVWAAQQGSRTLAGLRACSSATHMLAELQSDLVASGAHRPTALIIGAKGRVGTGVSDLCNAMGVATAKWDVEETASGGPFPEVLSHQVFFNCVLAMPGTPIFVPANAAHQPRTITVVGDIACDPDSNFSPVKVYDRITSWDVPAWRVAEKPPLDVMAIDNLPSLLPLESSEDFASQLLPVLREIQNKD
ncbi:MAG: saccharopine dehydrogenase, partial [Pseudomonadota bacterium]